MSNCSLAIPMASRIFRFLSFGTTWIHQRELLKYILEIYILWFDESTFSNSRMYHRKRTLTGQGKNLFLVKGSVSVLAFGAVTGKKYMDFMVEIHNKSLDELHLISRPNMHFQQDSLPFHNCKGTNQLSTILNHEWIRTHGTIQWPPMSA